jgi:hypothetical protein
VEPFSKRNNTIAGLALSVFSFIPTDYSVAQTTSNKDSEGDRTSLVKPSQEPATDSPLSALSLRNTSVTPLQDVDLPARVIDEATAKGLDLSTMKLEKDQWVSCTDGSCTPVLKATPDELAKYNKPKVITGLSTGVTLTITGHKYSNHVIEREPAYGIPGLGTFTTAADGTRTFTPASEFKGTVSHPQPKLSASVELDYSRETLAAIRARLIREPGTTFVVVISVPSQCPPCEQYAPIVREAASNSRDPSVVYKILNFNTFEEATAVTGVTRFPTTLFFPALPEGTRIDDPNAANWQSRPLLDGLKRPGYKHQGPLTMGPLRKAIADGLGCASRVVETGLRAIVGSISEFKNLGR